MEFPQLPTFGRGDGDGIVIVYIIILLLSIKKFHAAILRKPNELESLCIAVPGARTYPLQRNSHQEVYEKGDSKMEGMEGVEANQRELPMPLTSIELIVLAKSLKVVLNSEEHKEGDKEVIRKMRVRIDAYAERPGAYWDK